jgi:predicted DNA-binding transcriptional regulator AlpA
VKIEGGLDFGDEFFARLDQVLKRALESATNRCLQELKRALQEDREICRVNTTPQEGMALELRGDGEAGPLLNAKEAADFLRIGQRLLWSLTNCKDIPSVRIGRGVRYDKRDLLDWIDRQKSRRR